MVKRILVLLLTIIFMVGVNGCMNLFPQSDESIRDEILEHLNKKYDKEFVALALDRGHTDILLCYSQGENPETNLVHAQRVTRDKDVEYKDTYFGIVMRNEIEAEIMSICSDVNLPIQVFYPSNDFYYDNMFDGTKTYTDFRQWITDGNTWRFDITIVLALNDIADAEEYANYVFEDLAEENISLFTYLIILPSEGFEKVTRTNLNDILRQYDGQTATLTKSIN